MFCFKRVPRLPHDLTSFQSRASSGIHHVGILVQNRLESPVCLLTVSTLNQRWTLHNLLPHHAIDLSLAMTNKL